MEILSDDTTPGNVREDAQYIFPGICQMAFLFWQAPAAGVDQSFSLSGYKINSFIETNSSTAGFSMELSDRLKKTNPDNLRFQPFTKSIISVYKRIYISFRRIVITTNEKTLHRSFIIFSIKRLQSKRYSCTG